MGVEKKYWWGLTLHRVVTEDEERAENRLGPYATELEARNALKRVAERNEAWDTNPLFNDREDPDDDQRFDGSPKHDPDDKPEIPKRLQRPF